MGTLAEIVQIVDISYFKRFSMKKTRKKHLIGLLNPEFRYLRRRLAKGGL